MGYPKVQQDKGYAWAILFITLVYNIIEASVFMSPAIYLIAWNEAFDVRKAELGTVGSLLNGVTCFTGVFVGPIIAKYGCRVPSVLGSGICALGMFASVFAPSVVFLYLTYGCITGFGLGLLALPPIICVQYYFEKKRPFALGISLTGHSLGFVLGLPILQLAIESLGWRSALLLHTGVLMQCLVLGSLFLPIDISENENQSPKESEGRVCDMKRNVNRNTETTEKCNIVETQIVDVKCGTGICVDANQLSYIQSEEGTVEMTRNGKEDTYISRKCQTLDTENFPLCSDTNICLKENTSNCSKSHTTGGAPEAINYSIDNNSQLIKLQSQKFLQTARYNGNCCLRFKCFMKIQHIWNCSLLQSPAFCLFVFNAWTVEYCIGIFYRFSPIRAISEGVSEQEASFLPSVIAIVSTCFRIIVSFVANIPKVNNTVVCGVAVFGMAAVCILSSLAHDFQSYTVCAAFFGVFIGSYVSTVLTIMTDIVGIQNVAQAHSLLNAIISTAAFTNLPLAGFIIDLTGNYNLPFYVFGAMACVPGFIFCFLSCLFPELRKASTESKESDTQI